MRLIDVDNLLEKVFLFTENGAYIAEEDVMNAPTIDAVPVVRCKDCKHCDPETKHCDHSMGTQLPLPRNPDDFCSYGERKDGAE